MIRSKVRAEYVEPADTTPNMTEQATAEGKSSTEVSLVSEVVVVEKSKETPAQVST